MSGSFVKGCVVGLLCALVGGAAVALAGSGINGVFNLGVSNSVNAKTTLAGATPGVQLQVTNTSAAAGTSGLGVNSASTATTGVFTNSGGGSAGRFVVNAAVQPFTVNSQTKVANLNADLLDGLNSTGFLRNLVPLSLTGSTASGGVISATNTGTGNGVKAIGGAGANGVQGNSSGGLASGVYGENTGGGYGIAGRTNGDGHGAVFGENTSSTGPALELHTHGGAPIYTDSSVKVDRLNADLLDGIDSSAFAQGRIYTLAVSFPHDQSYFPNPAPAPGFFEISANCTLDNTGNYVTLTVTSQSNDPVGVISISDIHPYVLLRQRGDAISYQVLGHGVPVSLFIQGTPGGRQTVATANVGLVYRTPADGDDCHFQIQTLISQQ